MIDFEMTVVVLEFALAVKWSTFGTEIDKRTQTVEKLDLLLSLEHFGMLKFPAALLKKLKSNILINWN